ncbi:MAG: sensor domain-containing diguanylate cyclase [Gammaproteobacteria bacterium]|nr:sensor domain-containing diguanylate cyclase [Gammaproteobacteria bacterium]
MMRLLKTIPIIVMAIVWSLTAAAETLDVSREYQQAIGKYAQILHEDSAHLTMSDALDALTQGRFIPSQRSVPNFGIGAAPVWLAVDVENLQSAVIQRRLQIETSWLDRLDIYLVNSGQLEREFHLGDRQLFSERPIEHRFFAFEHGFSSGNTTVLIRVESPDPMVIPIYLLEREDAHRRDILQGYSYGIVYGVILALLAYNFILFVGLKSTPYLLYSIYLSLFLMTNISYTGHGYEWFWSDSPRWQLWSNPVLMVAYAVSGLVFATELLKVKLDFPKIYRAVIGVCLGVIALLVLAVLISSHVMALLVAFLFVFVFSGFMVVLGAISLWSGNQTARFFLLASISAICGASVTAMAVWGFIPYNALYYRAVDIGMMADAVLLAMALAERFRVSQDEKLRAEKMAGIDPLTELNNRRAFYEQVKPIWSTGQRHQRDTSVIMLDIDKFKQLNDSYGHAHGDSVLVSLAQVLKREAREGDILTRWGGEEFLIFLPETGLTDAISLANRLREKVAAITLEMNGEAVSITASFGVAHIESHDIALDELISIADRHLYTAKEHGRNRVCSNLSG